MDHIKSLPFKKYIWVIARYLVGLLLIFYLFSRGSFHFHEIIEKISLPLVISLFLLKLISFLFVGYRWYFILRELGASFTIKDTLKMNFMGFFLGYILPGNVTSDFAKGILVKKKGVQTHKVFISILLDRIIGLVSLLVLLLSSLFIFFLQKPTEFYRIIQIMDFSRAFFILPFGLVVFFLFFFLRKKIYLHLNKLKNSIHDIQQLKSHSFWLKTFALSFCAHLICILAIWIVGISMQLSQVNVLNSSLVFPLASLSLIVPITPGAIGVGQIVFQFLFNYISGFGAADGVMVFTVHQMVDFVFVILGLGLFLNRGWRAN